jgi:hypothetical protein
VLFAAGIALYLSATRAKDKAGHLVFWSLAVFLGVVYAGSLSGPPPPNIQVLAPAGLAMWLTVPWAAWADRHRQ